MTTCNTRYNELKILISTRESLVRFIDYEGNDVSDSDVLKGIVGFIETQISFLAKKLII